MKYSSHQKLMINSTAIADNIFVPIQEIIFIDSQVENYQILAQGVLPGIEVVVLTSDRNGIEQITAILSQKSDFLTSVHIVSHGSPGCLYLGNTQLNLDTLNKYQKELQSWSNQLSILLYGCNVAAGDAGEEFITKLHNITGAEIAASTTPIGNADLGGNWQLDVTTQSQQPQLAFNTQTQATYSGILAPGDLPWTPNPNNNGILVRGAAFLSCGTLGATGAPDKVIAVERVDIRKDGSPVIPTSNIEQAVNNSLAWMHPDWTQAKLGNIYGTAVDGQGNMFATASANYGSGVGYQGDVQKINYGSIGRDFGAAGELGAAGTIYKMDAVTGAPAVFAQLPQQTTTVVNIDSEGPSPNVTRQTGPGLGNIHYDKANDQFFVSNFEDGRIYRLDTNGQILDSYDPGTLDNGAAGAPPISELVYGLAVSPDGSKLFYGLNKTVYSIDLSTDGSLPGTVDNTKNIAGSTWNNYVGATETLHSTIPNIDPNSFLNSTDIIVSDLEFLPDGKLLVGGRVYSGDGSNSPKTIFSSYNHGGSVYRLSESGGKYSTITEIEGYSTVTQATGYDDGYGGVDYAQNLDGSFDYVVSSADIITEAGPHGIAVFPDNASNLTGKAEIVPRAAIGYDGINFDAKGVGGDVDVFNPGTIRGKISQDTTGDGNGDTNLSGITITLLDSTGNTIATATTQANGEYLFDNLLTGNYTVVQTQPSGLVSLSENEGGADDDNPAGDNTVNNQISVTVSVEEDDVSNDFVETSPPPTYKISGTVLEDTQAPGNNAIDNPGDTPIDGVIVELFAADGNGNPTGNAIATTTTDPTGNYEFTDLPKGNYVVVQTQPTGYTSVTDIDGGTDNKILARVNDADVTEQNFLEEKILIDYGDAPDNLSGTVSAADNLTNNNNDNPDYQTTAADSGASHILDKNCTVTIGTDVDADQGNGQNDSATADDVNGIDDEDGVFLEGTNTSLAGQDIKVSVGGKYSIDVVVHDGVTPIPTGVAATVSGKVYNDYDNDGIQELSNGASEVGLEGIIVTAYDSAGNVVSTAITDESGDYNLDNPNGQQLRVEFTDLPEGFAASAVSDGDANAVETVFFADGTTQTANLGLFDPDRYITNASPKLTIPCYVYSGTPGAGSAAAIVTVLHSDSGTSSRSPNTESGIVTVNQVGAVNGLAYNKETQDLFAGAFQKRHSDVKNQNNGVIYRIDTNNSNAVNELIDLEDFFGANAAGAYSHDSSNYAVDTVAFDAVGKVALGDVEISEDRKYIWTVNLADRSLYKIEIGDGTKHTADDGKERTKYEILGNDNTSPTNGGIPLGDLGLNPNANIRPFALAQKDGLIYVGMVNSAELNAAGTGSGTANDLSAYVYTFDPATETFSSSPVANFALNYPRERKGVNVPGEAEGPGAQAEWAPWVNNFNNFTFSVFGSGLEWANDVPDQTQPWLTDIEFDNNGNMILGLRDRTADQVGNYLPDPDGTVPSNDSPNNSPGNNTDGYRAFSGGDILRATPSSTTPGTWNIENIVAETDEFYDGDFFGNAHQETAQGGLVQLPGYNHIVTTAMDPLDFNSGGLIKLSNTNGAQTTPGIELYNDSLSGNFAKANGLGDVEYFGELAPIEIGNRIWKDTDGDGIQDAGESGVAGVTVSLYDADNNLVATTTTDAKGEYYFNQSNVNQNGATGLEPNTDYKIRLDNPADFADGGALNGFDLTVEDANANANDTIDSDAVDVSGVPTINVTTKDFGANNYTYDTGFSKDITLVGWIDFNRDGQFSDTEAVTLDTSNGLKTDGTANTLEFTVPAGVEAGPTAARFRVASGLTGDNLDSTTPNGAAPNGEVEDYVVNLVPTYKLSGTVYNDTNLPGADTIEPADTPIPGVTVELFNVDASGNPTGSAIASAVTDANGKYLFTDLADGNYVVKETQPVGYETVTDVDGGDSNQILATIAGADSVDNDFLEEVPPVLHKLSGTVYNDTNAPAADGIDPTDTPIAGVTVELFNADASGQPTGSAIASAITDATGKYEFTDLADGNYVVKETQPVGYETVTDVDGGDSNQILATIAGADSIGNDFLEEVPPVLYKLSGTVFNDTNAPGANGIEAADTPIAGVTVELFNADASGNPTGSAIATAVTDANGKYLFTDLADGNYVVVETQPAGFETVTDVDGGDSNQILATIAGADSVNNDFLEEVPPVLYKLSGTVFNDTNAPGANGIEAADTPIAGVTVELFNADASGQPTGSAIASAITDATGKYEFTDLADGNYVVKETQPSGFETVTDVDGGDSNQILATINGADSVNNDFLEEVPPVLYKLSGTVFNDTNAPAANGIEPADTPIPGVTVELFNADASGNPTGSAIASAITDANGKYLFTDLADGNYVVKETQPSGFETVTDVDGGDSNQILATINGADSVNNDFLEEVPPVLYKLSGTVFNDTNAPAANGIEPADTPIPGVTVELFNADASGNPTGSAIASAITDANGKYLFTDLADGNYVVKETQPAGFETVTDVDGGDSNQILATINGADSVNNDFLEEVPPVLYKLSGTVFNDTNAPAVDGIEATDTPIAGVTVELFNADASGQPTGSAIASAITDANGKYLFTDLADGNYVVKETQPAGFETVTDVDGGDSNQILATIAGADSVDNDFLEEVPPVLHKLSGTVYNDTNAPAADGIEATDTPIAGVTVELFNADASGQPTGSAIASAITDANGKYLFTDLADGNYVVKETQPAGFETVTDVDGGDSNQILATIAGADSVDNDFLEEVPPVLHKLSGTVYNDTNAPAADGIDPTDTPIAGVTVELFNADANGQPTGSAIATAVTDANGKYLFTDLADGNYVVKETQPAGYETVTDVDGGDSNQILATINGADSVNNDFLEQVPTYKLSGTVFNDTNAPAANGIEPADTPIPGVTVELFNVDASGNPTGSAIASAITDANGKYLFTDLADGNYVVKETQPAGFETVTDVDGGDSNQIAVTINGADVTAQNFLEEVPPVLYKLSGTVFNDTNAPGANGIEPADTPIAGVTVELFNADASGQPTGSAIATAVTDANGKYLFTDLADGNYVVVETQPAGFETVTDVDGGDSNQIAVTINGADVTAQNFLEEVPPVLYKLSGTVFNDTNAPAANGIEPADTPIAGVTVELFNADASGNPTGSAIATAVTDANGKYEFTDLADGNYVVKETQPVGYETVTDVDGGDSNQILATINGADSVNNDFLEQVPTYKLSGTVFNDTNAPAANGIEPADTPIAGVTVELFNADASGNPTGSAIATAVTDANGKYEFTDLADGNYVVKETQPVGYETVTDVDGGDSNQILATINGADSVNNDFLEQVPTYKLSGTVFNDTNAPAANGIEPADTPIPGVTVELFNVDASGNPTGSAIASAITDANGKYLFTDLADGNYVVKETQPAGYETVTDVDGGDSNQILATIAGADSVDNDFLEEVPPVLHKLSGTVYNDTNAPAADGIDPTDTPIAGVTVELFNADASGQPTGSAIASAITDATGKYEFTDLADGNYVVKETQPSGFETVTDVDGGDSNQILATIAGADSIGNDFLEEVPPVLYKLSGTVFNDTNAPAANGIEPADTPIPGVTVELFNADASGNPTGSAIASAITDATGKYEFTDLADGNYVVKETQPSGFETVTDVDGGDSNQILATINGADSVNNDFLEEVPPVLYKLSGTVFNDTNAPAANGIEPADTPIPGVTVELFNVDASGNPTGSAIASAITDANGKYLFTDLADGNYVVKETQPAGFETVTDVDGGDSNQIAVTINGADVTAQNFLEEVPPVLYKLSGTVFNDTNAPGANGIEPADTPIAGVTVELFNADASGQPTGSAIATAVTDANGKYLFTDLADGNYVVVETQPAGFETVTDVDGGDSNQIAVTINGADVTAQNFLEEVPPVLYKLSGTVFNDTNAPAANGIEPADTPIAGVTVELFNADASGNPTGSAIATAVTDANGKYEFTDLADGNYVVKETQPVGYETVTDVDGGDSNQILATINGADSVNNDFLEQVPTYKLSGTVFNDTNAPAANGIEPADTPIAGITVELFNADASGNPTGSAIASAITDANGKYLFTDLADGNYVVKETQPAGYETVTDVDGGDSNQILATIAGADSVDNDFLEEVPPVLHKLSGTVYNDTNAPAADGIDPTDTPIAGVTVELFNADASGQPTGSAIASAITDATGKYEFTDLADGNYVVKETQPSGFETVTDVDGGDSNQILATIAGADSIGNDFLEEVPPVLYKLSGTVFNDTNAPAANGIEPADTPIPGVTVELFNADASGNPTGSAIASAITDANGKYLFTDLADGNYVVKETQPAGYETVTDVDGGDSNQILATIAGADSVDNDFLEEVPPVLHKLSGTVYNDTNAPAADGIDPTDTPIAGVTVELFNADASGQPTGSAIASAITDATGKYEFTDLADGNYVVKETQPSGFETVTDVDGGDSNQILATIAGADSIGNDFLEEVPPVLYKLSGTVFNDTNAPAANGIEPADTPIPGVTVELFNADASGNPTGSAIASAITDANGKYLFTDLADGNYVVKETQPSGFETVTDVDGGDSNQILATINGADSVNNDFLEEVPPVLYKLSGTVFNDTNAPAANGIEPADTPIPGVTVELFNADASGNPTGSAIASAITDANGKYLFTDLADGNYVVKETQPSGFETVTDVDGGDSNQILATINGADSVNNDFLEEVPPVLYKLSGTVFNDTNAPAVDGIEATDTPIAGVTVELFNADASGQPTGSAIATAVTDANGKYLFTDLADGNYVVKETQPAGFETVTDVDGGDSNQILATINGADSVNNDFLEEVPPVLHKLSGTVYNDTNAPAADGIDPTDTPIAGVTVELFNADASGNPIGSAIASAVTDANGKYEFTDLADGNYVVKETQPAGFETVTDVDGGDSNQILATIAGADSIGNDFLEEVPPVLYKLSGTVFNDTNAPAANGIEPADTPIPGVTVELFNADASGNPTGSAIASAVTDVTGKYEFTDLADGNYVVVETQPAGFETVTDVDGGDSNQILATINGADSVNNDFLEQVPTYKLSGTVFNDTNAPGANGIEATDTPVAGVTVELFNADASGQPTGSAIATAVTDANGKYLFTDLADGNYVVVETQPAGFETVTDVDGGDSNQIAVTINGADVTAQNFLEEVPPVLYKLSGTVFNDTNAPAANGIEPADTPIAGVTVELFNADASGNPTGSAIATAVTDANGKYEFTDLADGNYVVKETQPVGYETVTDVDGGDSNQILATINGADSVNNDFLEQVPTYKLSGTVFNDTNAPAANGIEPADTPIAGVTVELFNADASGNPTGSAIATAVTDANGKYEFTDLADGNYVVKETQPVGYETVTDVDGGDSNQILATINGADSVNNDFLEQVPTYKLSGTVFNDTNAPAANGIEPADTPIPGVTVELFNVDASGNPTGSAIASAITDANGKYLFTDLADGNYVVKETQPAGYETVTDVDGGDSNQILATIAGADSVDNDFLEEVPPVLHKLSGTVYNDTNAPAADGIDPTDTPIAGVTVELFNADASGQPTGSAIASAITDATGKYEFTDLADGNYVVKETQPSGFETVTDVDGGDSNQILATIAGADSIGNDFLEEVPPVLYKLSGTVFNDTNAPAANGIEPADTPIPGVTVELFNADASGNPTGSAIASAITDANGKYLFTDLADGNYVVKETQPSGFETVTDVDGGDSNQILATINGADSVNNDFLEEVPPVLYKLSGTVFNDTNAPAANGIEPADTPIPGVTVELFNADASGNPTGSAIASAITDANGKYLFTDLADGNYVVKETQPAGFETVTDVDGGDSNQILATINGADSVNNDFLEEVPPVLYKLSGTVFNDTNAPAVDGIEATDTPIAGVTVELFNADASGQPTGSAIATAVTDANGKYLFTDLADGNYVVKETQPAGFETVTDVDGGDSNQILATINGADSVNNDFLEEVPPVLHKLSGTVYNDTNAPAADGIDPTDTPIAGVTVELFNADASGNPIGSAIASAVTDANGKYEFTDLADGNYVVKETQPAGFETVTDVDGGDSNQILATIAGADSIGNDFLEEVPPVLYKLSGTVFNDTNAPAANGIEPADTPIPGVTVELFNADASGNPTGSAIASAVTDVTGKYEFTDLADGNYVVVETQPAGFETVTDVDGGDSNQILATINGADSVNNDFLEQVPTYKLSGTVFNDTNAPGANGIEATDTPVAGVTVELFNADASGQPTGSAIATAVTDANGKYLFTDLADGNYVVVETQPAGFETVTDVDGGDSNQILATIAGADSVNNDFLEEVPPVLYKLSGTVFNDTNAPAANGIEPADTPIPGVTVELFNADASGNPTGSAIASAVTDVTGKYEFTDLADGNYVVVETQPAGFETVTDVDGGDSNQILATINGADSVNNDFLEQVPTYKLSGTVFNDTNAPAANGIEATDTPIAGVTVELFNADASGQPTGSAIASAVTDANGKYLFTDLADGNYVVVETQPAGYETVTDVDGGDSNQILATIAGADSVNNDFLEEVPPVLYKLSGTVFNDTNAPAANGIEPADTPIAGVTVELFNVDASGNPTGAAIATAVTDANGKYLFTDLADGNYVVKETQPAGFETVTDVDGGDSNQILATINGADSVNNNFLEEVPPVLYELTGRVFSDLETDGNFSNGDATIKQVQLDLLMVDDNGTPIGQPIATTTTDDNGFYRFSNLANGNYVVIERQPSGYHSVTDIDGANDNHVFVTINGVNSDGNNFLEVIQIPGTASPDVLVGTAIGEAISGYKGQDTLTGGGGRDQFVYTETSDGVDIITDFTTGEDQIDLSQIINNELEYSGSDPIADGYVVIANYGSVGSMIQIDFDSNGELLPKNVVFLDGVSDINPDTDLIF